MRGVENPQVVLMVTVGRCIRRLETYLSRYSRSDTAGILKEYGTIASCERAETGDVAPRVHAFWIYNLSNRRGVRVVARSEVTRLRERLESGHALGEEETGDDDDNAITTFDPADHALLCTDVTVASYMEGNPDHVLGAHANVVAPTFKGALVWWTCE